MALGLLDRCCSAETMMRFPAIYRMSQNRSDFNIKVNSLFSQFFQKIILLCRFFGLGVLMQFIILLFFILCLMRCFDMVRFLDY